MVAQPLSQQTSTYQISDMDTFNPWNQPVDQSGWGVKDTSFLDPRISERQDRVDGLPNLVAFWMEGVRAAERGEEVAKMAKFYDDLEAEERSSEGVWVNRSHGEREGQVQQWGEWGSGAEDWDVAGDEADWGQHIWPATQEWQRQKPASCQDTAEMWARWSGNTKRGSGDSHQDGQQWMDGNDVDPAPQDVWEFVSTYVQGQNVHPERRRQLYDFLEMPTDAKVQKIQDLVYRLRSNDL